MKRVVILGSTGSIGTSTLDVLAGLGDAYQVVGLAAGRRWEKLVEQARVWRPRWIALADAEARRAARGRLDGLEVLERTDDISKKVAEADVDVVVSAIVGAAGLPATLAAVRAGKTVALANKETLVMAGRLVMDLAAKSGATIVPVDSEHSAVYQCLQAGRREEVRRVILTASGGAFRDLDPRKFGDVTVEDALAHPTWNMGPKVTIDSATLMNKALEIVEARWLFDLEVDQIEVLIHPESVVHSLVEFRDGSVVAQLSPPDMRLPIQYALTVPHRLEGRAPRLRLADWGKLEFREPDAVRGAALELGRRVARDGGTTGAVLNAANEQAVDLFVRGKLSFDRIVPVCREVLDRHENVPAPTLEAVYDADRWARHEVHACLKHSATAC